MCVLYELSSYIKSICVVEKKNLEKYGTMGIEPSVKVCPEKHVYNYCYYYLLIATE